MRILDEHICPNIPEGLKVLETHGPNGWVVAMKENFGNYKTIVWNIRTCPYCDKTLYIPPPTPTFQ